MNIEEKAKTITQSAIEQWKTTAPTEPHLAACVDLAIACALLTSTVKAEREEGKAMVRRWKNGNTF